MPQETDRQGSPCDTVFEWIEMKKFENKQEALEYLKRTDGNQHAEDCIQNYPWGESIEERIIALRKEGNSRNEISRILRLEGLKPSSHNFVQSVLEENSLSGKLFRVFRGLKNLV